MVRSARVRLQDLPPAQRDAARQLKRAAAAAERARFCDWCERAGLPRPMPEFRFHAERRWRFDFAWPEHRVALEVEGGVWTGGRHTRGAGYLKDMEKYNAAALAGWSVLRTTPADLYSAATRDLLRAAL